MIDYLLLAAIMLLAALALCKVVRMRKKGGCHGSCCGDCSQCSRKK